VISLELKFVKRNPYLSLVNDYLIDSPCPSNLNYFWNFGSLLGLIFAIVLVSGITLAMHYTNHIDLAFASVEHITRDVHSGWLLRYFHANAVGLFFILVYIHVARGLFYGSYRQPRSALWILGVIILILMMAIAFIGYVLPMGQMSLWGSVVITNLFSAIPWIGPSIVSLLWGGFSVANPTLNRFFSLHFLLPFVLAALIIMHIMALHQHASNNPLGITSQPDRVRFHPYYTSKDLVGFILLFIILSYFVFFDPSYLGHPDNNVPANPLVTPLSIVPEFYLLPFYAILRAIPSKLGGVLAMIGALLILLPLAFFHSQAIRSLRFRPFMHLLFWSFLFNFLFLLWLGAKPIHEPYIALGQLATLFYFFYFLLLFLFN